MSLGFAACRMMVGWMDGRVHGQGKLALGSLCCFLGLDADAAES